MNLTLTLAELEEMPIGYIIIFVSSEAEGLQDVINTALSSGMYELVGPANVAATQYPIWTATVRRIQSTAEILRALRGKE